MGCLEKLGLEERLKNTEGLSFNLVYKAYKCLDQIREQCPEHHGYLLVLGYDEKKWSRLVSPADQDVFENTNYNLLENGLEALYRARFSDGAILIDREGNVLRGGVNLNVDTRKAENKFGCCPYNGNHGMRHRYAWAASCFMQNGSSTASLITLSKRDGKIRIHERGKIIYAEEKGGTFPSEQPAMDTRLLMI